MAALAALVLTGAGSGSVREQKPEQQAGPVGRFTLDDARAFDDYALFFAGDRVESQPLAAVLRRSDTAEFVSFVYGDCVTADDLGCAPPIEIQIWPACRRHLALYGLSGLGSTLERTTVRGVPAAVLDDGTRLELQSGRSTIVVFADSRVRAARVAGALRRLDATDSAPRNQPLLPPAAGALEGTLAC